MLYKKWISSIWVVALTQLVKKFSTSRRFKILSMFNCICNLVNDFGFCHSDFRMYAQKIRIHEYWVCFVPHYAFPVSDLPMLYLGEPQTACFCIKTRSAFFIFLFFGSSLLTSILPWKSHINPWYNVPGRGTPTAISVLNLVLYASLAHIHRSYF